MSIFGAPPRIDTDESFIIGGQRCHHGNDIFTCDKCKQATIDGVKHIKATAKKGGLTGTNLTGSSTKNERKESDFYPTPPEVTQALMLAIDLPGHYRVWEPACGDGRMSEVIKPFVRHVTSSDIRETGYGLRKPLDYLSGVCPHEPGFFDAIITNPPFNLAANFIEQSMKHDVKVVAMLVKANYWHAQKRIGLFTKYPPSAILALTWRADFCFGERGGGPPMDCSWMVWIKGFKGETQYKLLRKPEQGQTFRF